MRHGRKTKDKYLEQKHLSPTSITPATLALGTPSGVRLRLVVEKLEKIISTKIIVARYLLLINILFHFFPKLFFIM